MASWRKIVGLRAMKPSMKGRVGFSFLDRCIVAVVGVVGLPEINTGFLVSAITRVRTQRSRLY